MTEQEKKFIGIAIELAEKHSSSGDGGPFAAIIVKNNEIIAEGWNTVTSTNDPTAHAEVNSIRNACKKIKNFDLSGCSIYTSCEPCPMCLSAIFWARLDKIFFAANSNDAANAGFDDSTFYKELALPNEERVVKMTELNHENKLNPFQKWIANSNKTEY